MNLVGLKIVESALLLETVTVDRTWRERLMSWPWCPWVRQRSYQVPSKQMYRIGDTIVMHPAMVAEFRKAAAEARSLEARQ